MGRLDGKAVLVVDGDAPLGRAAAVLFAREGANVFVGERTAGRAQLTVAQIEDGGGLALRFQVGALADVSVVPAELATAVVRQLQASKIRAIQNVWTAQELVMSDLPRGTRTRLALDKIQYNLPFKDSDFTVQALRR